MAEMFKALAKAMGIDQDIDMESIGKPAQPQMGPGGPQAPQEMAPENPMMTMQGQQPEAMV